MSAEPHHRQPDFVCGKCGGERIDAEFTARGWAKAEIATDKNGKPYVEHTYDHEFDSFDEDHEQFTCADCNASWYPLEKGVKPPFLAGIDFEPADIVVLPDGFKAVVATVNREDNTFTVEGWHETFKAGEAAPLMPMEMAA